MKVAERNARNIRRKLQGRIWDFIFERCNKPVSVDDADSSRFNRDDVVHILELHRRSFEAGGFNFEAASALVILKDGRRSYIFFKEDGTCTGEDGFIDCSSGGAFVANSQKALDQRKEIVEFRAWIGSW